MNDVHEQKVDGNIHQFEQDKIEEFRAAFDAWNLDENAHLDQGEMNEALNKLGVDTDLLQPMLQEVDANKDGAIDLDEFLNALWMVNTYDRNRRGSSFSSLIRKTVQLVAIDTSSGGVKSYTQEEVTAFANHLNMCLGNDPTLQYLMPIDSRNMDLIKKVQDGVLLAAFINMIEPDTIDFRAVNYKKDGGKLNQFQVIENHNLNIAAAKSIGIQISNISAEDLRDAAKNPILVLGMMWQMVRLQLLGNINLMSCPELIKLLRDGEDLETLLALEPEMLLKRWVNYHMEKQEYLVRIKNFGSDVKDAKVYTVLLKSLGEAQGCDLEPLKLENPRKRAFQVLENARKIGATPFLTEDDIVNANDKFNLAFVAQLFNTNPGLGDVEEEEQKELAGLLDEDDVGDSREERAFRMWMNSLGIDNLNVQYLFEDCHNGLVLLKVIDKIESGIVNWKKAALKPSNRFKKVQNTNYCVDLGKQMKFSLVNVGGTDIVERNKKLILGFTWQLMRYHMLKFLQESGKPLTDKDVVSWCNNKIKASKRNEKPQIKTFKDPSIGSGVYFIHLVAAVEPNIVDWNMVTKASDFDEKKLNARYAISLARKIGAVVFLLPEDIIEVRSKMCMTFCAAVMQASKKN